MLSDTEYSDFEKSGENEGWAEYRQSFWEYMEEAAQPDFEVVTDEEELDDEEQETKVSPSQFPADVFQFESGEEVNLSKLPSPKQSEDEPTESAESDLTCFTPDQVASIWAATMRMQREVYAI